MVTESRQAVQAVQLMASGVATERDDSWSNQVNQSQIAAVSVFYECSRPVLLLPTILNSRRVATEYLDDVLFLCFAQNLGRDQMPNGMASKALNEEAGVSFLPVMPLSMLRRFWF
jgi:hypothetical protein